MATPGSLSEREADDARRAIYERSTGEASDGRDGRVWLKVASGATAGAVLAFVFAEVGAFQIFAVGRLAMLIPFMAAGALIGATRFLRAIVVFALMTVFFLLIISYTDILR